MYEYEKNIKTQTCELDLFNFISHWKTCLKEKIVLVHSAIVKLHNGEV